MTKHSKFSPSGAKKWMDCHLSLTLEATLPPDNTPKPAADYGSMCHLLAEEYLSDKVDYTERIGEEHYGQVVDEVAVDIVRTYVEYCEYLRAEYLFASEELVEETVDLEYLAMDDIYGTADFILYSETYKRLFVVDLKAGSGVKVHPLDNPQLKIYALGAIGKFDIEDPAAEVIMVIVQPRDNDGNIIKTSTMTIDELEEWALQVLEPEYHHIIDGSTKAAPSEDNCRWCRAKGICEPFQEQAQLEAIEVFKPLADKKSISSAVGTMGSEDILDTYEKLPLLKMFIKAIEAEAYRLAEAGETDRYKVVKGRKKRSWTNEVEVRELCMQNGIDPFEPHKLLSPAKLEKLFGKSKSKLKDLITFEHGKPIMVEADDKREAVNNLAIEFNEFI